MARMHTRKRGQAKSRKAFNKPAPSWVKLSKEEIVALVVKLSKEGKRESDIGQVLRDQYGVPLVKNMTGKTISQIIVDGSQKIGYPDDLISLIRKAVRVANHLKANKGDAHNTTKLIHIESKIKRLVKYYRRSGRLPPLWVYSREQAALLVK